MSEAHSSSTFGIASIFFLLHVNRSSNVRRFGSLVVNRTKNICVPLEVSIANRVYVLLF